MAYKTVQRELRFAFVVAYAVSLAASATYLAHKGHTARWQWPTLGFSENETAFVSGYRESEGFPEFEVIVTPHRTYTRYHRHGTYFFFEGGRFVSRSRSTALPAR